MSDEPRLPGLRFLPFRPAQDLQSLEATLGCSERNVGGAVQNHCKVGEARRRIGLLCFKGRNSAIRISRHMLVLSLLADMFSSTWGLPDKGEVHSFKFPRAEWRRLRMT